MRDGAEPHDSPQVVMRNAEEDEREKNYEHDELCKEQVPFGHTPSVECAFAPDACRLARRDMKAAVCGYITRMMS